MPDGVLNMRSLPSNYSRVTAAPMNWLAHWSHGTGLSIPARCQAYGCLRPAQVGAQVKHIGSSHLMPWIVPFCEYHQQRPLEMPVVLKQGSVLYGAVPELSC